MDNRRTVDFKPAAIAAKLWAYLKPGWASGGATAPGNPERSLKGNPQFAIDKLHLHDTSIISSEHVAIRRGYKRRMSISLAVDHDAGELGRATARDRLLVGHGPDAQTMVACSAEKRVDEVLRLRLCCIRLGNGDAVGIGRSDCLPKDTCEMQADETHLST